MRTFTMIVTEGALEIPASRKLLAIAGVASDGITILDQGGRSRFWMNVARYNQAALHMGPILGLADLEDEPCPSGLLAQYLPNGRHPDFVLRIAERMLESWLLADRNLASFLQVSPAVLPHRPDAESNPKRCIVNLARRSESRAVRSDLVPDVGSLGVVGKGYTPRMTEFIESHWRPDLAQKRSESLRRALVAIRRAASKR